MQRKRKYCFWLMVALACCQHLFAQVPGGVGSPNPDESPNDNIISPTEKPFTVRDIFIDGNRKTRPEIIKRELTFRPGDQLLLQDLIKRFEFSRNQLMNTTLFHEVVVALKSFDGYNVDVNVQVKERWYIFPLPYFKPIDRNLNQWLVEQKGSLKRVNYGAKLLYNNVTGRNDKLRLWLIHGYTRQFQFGYERMFIDRRMKWGLSFNFASGNNREVNYNTIDNKQTFFKDDSRYLRRFTNASVQAIYRERIKTTHRFGVGFVRERLEDTILKLNPRYFNNGASNLSFPEFWYSVTYLSLDYIPYPTKGYAFEANLSKRGINKDMNSLQASAKASANWPLSKKAFFSLNGFGTVKVPFRQPFYNRQLLGYGDQFMQGYEYYVVDGVAGGFVKAALTRKMLGFDFRIPGLGRLAPQRIPINVYAKVFGNMGYIHNPEPGLNSLNNKMLFSSGVGVDITSIYDFTLKIEWSFNQLGQNGLFFHRRTIF